MGAGRVQRLRSKFVDEEGADEIGDALPFQADLASAASTSLRFRFSRWRRLRNLFFSVRERGGGEIRLVVEVWLKVGFDVVFLFFWENFWFLDVELRVKGEEWGFLFAAVVVARVSETTWSFKDAVLVVWEEAVVVEFDDDDDEEEEERNCSSFSFA